MALQDALTEDGDVAMYVAGRETRQWQLSWHNYNRKRVCAIFVISLAVFTYRGPTIMGVRGASYGAGK